MSLTPSRLLVGVMMTAACLTPYPAQAVPIVPGFDFFNTDHASVDLPGVGTVALKGRPFPPDNPLFPLPMFPALQNVLFNITWLNEHGNQVGPDSIHKVSQLVTPVPGTGPFDTIVQRTQGVDITGVGSEAEIAIQIVWLSLMSVAPIDGGAFGIPFAVDVYVGLSSAFDQTAGRLRLTSSVADGSSGLADIGFLGVTTDVPSAPGFLGLPVTYQVILIPAGMDPLPQNIVFRQDGLESVFHCNDGLPCGTYNVVSEPTTLLLLGSGLLSLTRARRLLIRARPSLGSSPTGAKR